MEKTMNVAKALYDMYFEQNGLRMDEMKMHKLMYFSQRESLMCKGKLLFDGTFYGWKYGPVLKEVRCAYAQGAFLNELFDKVSDDTMELLKQVYERYGMLSSWKLSSLSHEEFSWKTARKGLAASDDGDTALLLDAMRVDATRELMKRKQAMA